MKVEYNFIVEKTEASQPSFSTTVFVSDDRVYSRLEALAFEKQSFFSQKAGSSEKIERKTLKVTADEGDPKLLKALEILAEYGKYPSNHFVIPQKDRATHFGIQRKRHLIPKDIREADYLKLNWGNATIADPHMSYPHKEYRDGRPLLKVNQRLKTKREFGTIDFINEFVCNDRVKQVLESSGLKGLEFEPVWYDKPEKAPKQLYHLRSSVMLPPCLLPRQNERGEDTNLKTSDTLHWDDGGYVVAELKFNRAEVEKMSEWDIACTQEYIGLANRQRRELVVSQKFREILEKNKIKGHSFIPVRLID